MELRQFTSTQTTWCTLKKKSLAAESEARVVLPRWSSRFPRTKESNWTKSNKTNRDKGFRTSWNRLKLRREKHVGVANAAQGLRNTELVACHDLDRTDPHPSVVTWTPWVALSNSKHVTSNPERTQSGSICSRVFQMSVWSNRSTRRSHFRINPRLSIRGSPACIRETVTQIRAAMQAPWNQDIKIQATSKRGWAWNRSMRDSLTVQTSTDLGQSISKSEASSSDGHSNNLNLAFHRLFI